MIDTSLMGLPSVVASNLHHLSAVGEFFLASDSVMPTFAGWPAARKVIDQIPEIDRESFLTCARTIGAMMIFPGRQIDRLFTINQARGMYRTTIADRFDLTLECIRRHYLGPPSPLGDVLARYADFLTLFVDFRGYVEFFLLQDLVDDAMSSVRFFLPFDDVQTPAIPADSSRTSSTADDRSSSSMLGTGGLRPLDHSDSRHVVFADLVLRGTSET